MTRDQKRALAMDLHRLGFDVFDYEGYVNEDLLDRLVKLISKHCFVTVLK